MKTEDSLPFFVCFILRPCLVKIKTQSYDLMLVYQHSPEKQRKKAIQCVGGEYLCVCTCVCLREKLVYYFRKSAHTIVRASKSQICRAG